MASPVVFEALDIPSSLPQPISSSEHVSARTNAQWLAAMISAPAIRDAALRDLRAILLKGLRAALKSRGDASQAHLEDFAQEALLRVVERYQEFRGTSQFTTWARAIAVNIAFAELRRKRWQDVSLDTLTSEGAQLSAPGVLTLATIETEDERLRLLETLRRAIDEALTERQRTALRAGFRGLPIDQIVQLLDTNRAAMYKLYHDARRTLKARLEAEGISAETIRHAFRT
jgi:RNA polymerase sigma-70 factor (ECF subfamily)